MSDRFHKIPAKYFFKILRKQSVIDGWKAETRINGRENSIPPLKLNFAGGGGGGGGGLYDKINIIMSQAAIIFKRCKVFTFSHVKAYVLKVDTAVK